MHPEIAEALQQISAALFNGDTFDEPNARRELTTHLEQWCRELGLGTSSEAPSAPRGDLRVSESVKLREVVDFIQSLLATRALNAEDATSDRLSDAELYDWSASVAAYLASDTSLCLRLVLDEILARRAAEATFTRIDLQLQSIECGVCDARESPDCCPDHQPIGDAWKRARANLCEQARIHRGYLRSLNAPGEGDLP